MKRILRLSHADTLAYLPLSMIVSNLYVKTVTSLPSEHDAPLIVDPNRVKALPLSPQGLKAVAGGGAQVFQLCCIM